MDPFTCPICGGKLNIKIGADFALCDSCGKAAGVDPKDAAKFREIYETAERLMRSNKERDYLEAIKKLDAISFIDEAKELSGECRRRLTALQAERAKRRELEKASAKKDTALGVILFVITLLIIAGLIAGAIYLVVRLVNGTLPPAAVTVVCCVAVIAFILIFLRRTK